MDRRTKVLRTGNLLLAALPLAVQIAAEASQTPAVRFVYAPVPGYLETLVRPVLAANCYDCHAEERMGGLRLDSRDGLVKGGDSVPRSCRAIPTRAS